MAELLSGPSGRWGPTITLTPRHCGFSLILQADLTFANGQESERFMIRFAGNTSTVRSCGQISVNESWL